jgi:hypothetical protein
MDIIIELYFMCEVFISSIKCVTFFAYGMHQKWTVDLTQAFDFIVLLTRGIGIISAWGW